MLSTRIAQRVATAGRRQMSSIFGNDVNVSVAKINAKRAKYYSNPATGAENPTFLKEPGDKVLYAMAGVLVVTGWSLFFKGVWNMFWGINKKA